MNKQKLNISIREAALEDIPILKQLFKETILKIYQKEYSFEERIVWSQALDTTDKWENFIKNEYFIVAESNHKIIGFSSLRNRDYLNLLYIHHNYNRKGVASALYQNIKSKSINFGVDKLTADVSKTAKPFFEKMGFEVLKENHHKIEKEVLINYTMIES